MREGWEEKLLSEVYDVRDGTHDSPKYQEDGFPLITSKNLKEGIVNYDKAKFISKEDYDNINKRSKVDVGDVLFAMIGTIGSPTVVIQEPDYAIKNVALFKVNTLQNSQFLKYYLESQFVIDKMLKDAKGTTQRFVGLGYLRKFPISIPPLTEQKQIVEILDKAFAAIDQAKANLEKNIANAKELFQSKLNEIFSQKGDGWEERELNEIGQVQTGTTPPTRDKSNYGNFIPFVKPPHFAQDGSINTEGSMLSKEGLKKGRLFAANSILMVCIGATIGKTGFSEIPVSSNQQINALTPNKNFVPKLLYFALISPFVQSQVISLGVSAQATLPIINKSKWLKLRVNLPINKREQALLVNQLKSLSENSLEISENYSQKIISLDELKKSILQKAFSGELTSPKEA